MKANHNHVEHIKHIYGNVYDQCKDTIWKLITTSASASISDTLNVYDQCKDTIWKLITTWCLEERRHPSMFMTNVKIQFES